MSALIKQRLAALLRAGIIIPKFATVRDCLGKVARKGEIEVFVPNERAITFFSFKGYWIRLNGKEAFLPSEELERHTDGEWRQFIKENGERHG
ncbi:hypothetical protein COZ83_00900 [Candidatus Kaiserbacteria bacterium CG_4_8_14_3_um_filter_50_23]|uniref:Uncharacterized protein n=1 Tax=Candidatus Kaiserbacteria bacterium CG17_big_fil_post_rev_8_21_14_2_50_51_7 TaxID=1974613 RepID=A0A2M7FDR4_9BACT|nr:MAG: hypothetical protein COW49_01360 [Candidatus Kaiserbacteria bacterium CG17_big_fil_post_rev_8_21_14_2_50_51_7]PIW96434.1 MAG: hypothetical protein COZ83_00900 [Candidatus Kaiserbacteria bacterium CG_4_8_14_3_um_filter_50_23]